MKPQPADITPADIIKETLAGEDFQKQDLVVSQAEPHIEKMAGKIMVIKCSGTTVSSQQMMQSFARDIVCLRALGIKPVVVHGGGAQITKALNAAGIKSSFKRGLRITDAQTMEVVADVLVKQVGKELTAAINATAESYKEKNLFTHQLRAELLPSHFSGKQTGQPQEEKRENICIQAEQLDGELGFVGKVKAVDTKTLTEKLDTGIIPVISSIGRDEAGQLYNINADTAASEIAIALSADRLHFLTNVDGVYTDVEDVKEKDPSHISEMNISEVKEMISAGKIQGGMIPKLEACCASLESGVQIAHMLNGSKPSDLIFELFTDAGIGTMITKEGDTS